MKRLFCLLLMFLLLLCGCNKKDRLSFYYCNSDYLNSKTNEVLCSEDRDVTGYTQDLPFLISLYLAGPLDQDLFCPFPEGTKLQNLFLKDSHLTVQLQNVPQNMSDSDFSLACACLSMTCISISDVQTVTILAESRSVTMDQSVLTLSDSPIPTPTSSGG